MKTQTTLKYLGHSGFFIEFGGKKLVVDPFFTKIEGIGIEIKDIDADYILLTHGHFDHIADVEAIAKNTGAEIITAYEIATWLGDKGFTAHGMNIGGKINFEFGTVKYVTAVHSSQLPDGSYGGPAGGFVIWNDDASFYIAGDTALTMDMSLIPMTCPSLDFAILPIGDRFTMDYKDAILASDFIACDNIIPCHFDTFDIIKVDKETAVSAFREKSKNLIWMEIKEEISI